MKVLHIFNSLMPSGAETMWVAASACLRQQGVVTHVLATAQDVGPYAARMRAAGFVVHHIPHGKLDIAPYALRLRRLLVRESYDAVQVHVEGWRLTNCLISRICGVPSVVSTIHSVFKHSGVRWARRCVCLRLLRRLGVTLVACGRSVQKNERRFLYRPLLIWNWVDVGRFARVSQGRLDMRRKLQLNEQDKVLICVGNCRPLKNHNFLFRVLGLLPEGCKLLHVGKEDECLNEREVARVVGVGDRVIFLGARDDVPDLLGCADVFVMSSTEEGFSIACVEAARCGLPMVVSDVPGLRDAAEMLPLCVASPLDEATFAHKITNVLGWGNEQIERVRVASRTVIDQMFSTKVNVRQYVALWRGQKVVSCEGYENGAEI